MRAAPERSLPQPLSHGWTEGGRPAASGGSVHPAAPEGVCCSPLPPTSPPAPGKGGEAISAGSPHGTWRTQGGRDSPGPSAGLSP